MNTNKLENNPLHLGLEFETNDASQPFLANGTTGWFEPRERIRGLEGVVKADYIETTSSAGDWSGWFAVENEGKFYLVTFSQENKGFCDTGYGYRCETGDAPFAIVENFDDIEQTVFDWVDEWNDM